MKKLLLAAVASTLISTSMAVHAKDVSVKLNRSSELLDTPAISDGGKLLLPLHDLVYATGDRIRYDSQSNIAYLTKNGEDTVCFYASAPPSTSTVEQYPATLNNGTFYISSENYVKIFGGSVAWDKEENVINVTENNYRFSVNEVQLYRPSETIVKTNNDGETITLVYEEYSETLELKNGVTEYTKEVEEGRIPIVSLPNTYYGIEYTIKQAFKNRPTATITLNRDNETYVYTITFKECSE